MARRPRSSKADREAVPVLSQACNGDVPAAARHLHRDVRFATRWAERHAAEQGTDNKQGQGRKRSLDGAAVPAAKRIASGRTKVGSRIIAKRLHDSGKTPKEVSNITIRRASGIGTAAVVWMSLARRHHPTARNTASRLPCTTHKWETYQTEVSVLQAPPKSRDLSWMENI